MEKFLNLFNNDYINGCIAFILLMIGTTIYLFYPIFNNKYLIFAIFGILIIPFIIKYICNKMNYKMDKKHFKIYSIFISITIPLLSGMSISNNLSIIDAILQLMLYFASAAILTNDVINKLIPDEEKKLSNRLNISWFILFVVYLINPHVPIIIDFLLDFSKPTDFIIIALTMVLLTATLSLLSFTYNMVLEKEEKKLKKRMRHNGEIFFKATLYSTIFLICSYIIVNYGLYVNVTKIVLNPITLDKMKNLYIFSILILISFISGAYTITDLFIAIKDCLQYLNTINIKNFP